MSTQQNRPLVFRPLVFLDGVDKSEWVKTTKDEIKKFRPAIPISGRFIRVTKDTGREYTNSGYSRKLRSKDEARYRDKLTAAGNLDEIVIASTKYVNEGLNHPRTDDIKDFARGNVLLQVGERKYSAEVVIGLKTDESMVLHDIVNITDNDFEIKKETNPKPSTSGNRASSRQDSSPTNRVPQNEESVNSYSMRDGELYSQGKKVSIPKDARIVKNIVLDEVSSYFRKKNPKGYKAIEIMAQDLGMKVKFVKGLFDSEGNALDGVETDEGIFINTEAKNPIKWAATHEFSHTMKKSASEAWSAYENFVIDKMKKDGSYYALFEIKALAYGTRDVDYINEEIACDHIGETFDSVDELADFIKKDRGLAVKVRDFYYKALDKLGLVDEKKKAQLMWRDAYRKAVLNKKGGKVESKPVEKKSVSGTRASEIDSSDEKGYNNGEQFRTMWTIEEGVLSNKEVRQFYSEIQNLANGSEKYTITSEGDYVIEVDNKLVYTDGDFDYPTISKVVTFNVKNQTEFYDVKEFYDDISSATESEELSQSIIEDVYGEGIISRRNFSESQAYARQRGRGKGANSKATDRGTRKSISGTRASEIEDTTSSDTEGKFIPPGAKPRRDVKVPESIKEGTKVRQFARTAAEAETLTEKTAEGVLENVEQGKFNYIPISNKSTMKNAYASLDTMGVEWVEKKVSGAIFSHSLDKQTVAMAEVLMQKYSNEGQYEKAQKLIVDFAAESTRVAQSLQAISMLKKLDPNYEVAYIDKIVENLREEIIERNNKKFGKKHSADIEVSEELKTKLMEAKTEEEREAVRDEIYTEIAEQLPDSWVDKWNAWRYMAMLGNAKTHVRNVAGNTAFMPMIAVKNIAAKFVEPIVAKFVDGRRRTGASHNPSTTDGGPPPFTQGRLERITVDMDEDARYEVLKDKKISPVLAKTNNSADIDFEYLEKNIKSVVEKPLISKLRSLGCLTTYKTNVADVNFELTGRGVGKSLHSQTKDYGGSFADFTKVMLNLKELLENSLLVEAHSDKAKGTARENPQLKQTYVLFSALQEKTHIIPVQFEIKEYVDENNRLYLAVALTKIETSVMGNTILDGNQASTYLLPISNISISEIFAKINPADKNFLKYIPNQFLNDEQIKAKNVALEIEKKKYSGTTHPTSTIPQSAKSTATFTQGNRGKGFERSKTFFVGKKYRQFAAKDVETMRKELQGGGKHNPSDIIRDKKQIFDTQSLEWMRVKLGDSLEAEDWLFLKHHYKVALSNYLAANKIDLDNMSEAVLDRARTKKGGGFCFLIDFDIKPRQKFLSGFYYCLGFIIFSSLIVLVSPERPLVVPPTIMRLSPSLRRRSFVVFLLAL